MMKKLLFTLFLLLVGCVGTVEEKNPQNSKSAKVADQGIAFSGITEAVAVSDSKVMIKFLPASGNQADLTYLVYVNASLIPIEVKSEGLQTDTSGNYLFVVNNLGVNQSYSFSVGVRKSSNGEESKNNKTLFATTFANFTADFNGVASVYPSAGSAGENEIQVEWIPAVTKGSEFSPKAGDPIGYEIRYMKASDGSPDLLKLVSHPSVKTSLVPASLTISSPLSTERKRAISGLISGTKYFVMVRAYHKAWVTYNSDVNYKLEQNEIIKSVTTLESGGVFDWDIASVKISTPPGEQALTKMDVRWDAAQGPFYSYRLYLEKVGEPNEDLATVEANAPVFDSNYIDTLTAQAKFSTVTPDIIFKRVENLESYAYYRTTVVACATSACIQGQRLEGNVILFRVTPEIAPFSGVLRILDPESLDKIDNPGTTDTIKVTFDPPVLSAGYANKFEIYCYENLSDNSPTYLGYEVVNTSGKPGCNGLKVITPEPTTPSAIAAFDEVEVEFDFIQNGDIVSDRDYCFGAIPVIEGTNFTKREISNAIVKCRRFEINVPKALEFPGAKNICNPGADSLEVTWDEPINGLYTNYAVFWKENDGNPFKFADAINGVAGYTKIDGIADSATSHTITGLKAGKSYQYGVLSYIDKATDLFSEANTGIINCTIPYPVPRFDEWVDIFAVGPKEDGRIPQKDTTGEKSFLFETLNIYGQPIDVEVQNFDAADYAPTATFKNQFGDISSGTFDGVFGRYRADKTVTEQHQYSNSGIIRIAWKDITFDSGATSMSSFITTFSDGVGLKSARKYGYRVYRSHDNGVSWINLTKYDSNLNPFQLENVNEGLIHPIDFTESDRANSATSTFKAGVFVDYSVKDAGHESEAGRARVYLYKVVPVFDGVELTYERNSTNPQHIIKIVLPPPNMGLVHRLMANRQTCKEVGKTYVKDISTHYSCSWDGVGARSLSSPWIVGNTVYDFGSDMLMDRFEMGCEVTRGHQANTDSYFGFGNTNFEGLATSGNKFRGCLSNTNSSRQQDNLGDVDPWDDSKKFRVGDCLFQGRALTSSGYSTVCADPAKVTMHTIWFPGASNFMATNDCTQTSNLFSNFIDPYDNSGIAGTYLTQVAQSEYLGVSYHQVAPKGDLGQYIIADKMRGASGDGTNANKNIIFQDGRGIRASRCMINIPVMDQTDSNRLVPRWIPANLLDYLSHDGTTINLLNKTVTQVESMLGSMFDLSKNSLPDESWRYGNTVSGKKASYNARYLEDSTLPQVFSSNAAKLPPLNGFSQKQAQTVCESYKVKVGLLNTDGSTFTQIGQDKSKRLMRRTEGVLAAAHPKSFNDTKINNIENSTATEAAITSGVSYNGSCNSYNRNVDDGQHSNLEAGGLMSSRYTSSYNGNPADRDRPPFISGSSFVDPDGENYNTQNCTSRFGIHDLIGNVDEYSSERFFCDFSGEELYFGVDNNQSASISSTQYGVGLYNTSNIAAWVLSSPDTGRCSIIEDGSSRSMTTSIGGIMLPVYDFFGNINSTMIPAFSRIVDKKSMGDWRNGDGFFADFGQQRLLPPVSVNDTLALKLNSIVTSRSKSGSDPRAGSYFNPIIGLPLTCDNSCDNSLDNKSISTTDFVTLRSLDPLDLNISDFPVGNSNIYSDGMSEKNDWEAYSIPNTNAELTLSFVEQVYPLNNGPDGYVDLVTNYNVQDPYPATIVQRTSYLASRTTDGYALRNFGSSVRNQEAGRYSLYMRSVSNIDMKGTYDSGFRCVVKIEDEVY